jgi:hypothetical protein
MLILHRSFCIIIAYNLKNVIETACIIDSLLKLYYIYFLLLCNSSF